MSEVVLHVYDLAQGMAAMFGYEGVWHTGVVVHGLEYAFGAGTGFGVHTAQPHQSVELSVKKVHRLGVTTKSKAEFDSFVQGLQRFHGTRYHLLENNCNHFSDVAVQFLLDGATIPEYISGLPARFKADARFAMFRPLIEQFSGPAFNEHASGMVGDSTAPTATAEESTQPSSGHRHNQLQVPHSTVTGVTTFDGGDPDKMMDKYQQICDQSTSADIGRLREAAKGLGSSSGWPSAATGLLDRMVKDAPWDCAYPLVDLLRLAMARDDAVLDYFCHVKCKTLRRLFNDFSMNDTGDRTSIVAMRLFANILRNSAGTTFITQSSEVREQYWGIICAGLESSNIRVKQAASSCAYNFALKVATIDQDACLECLAFIQYILGAMETDSGDGAHDEIAFRLLSAVGHLIYGNDSAVETLKEFGDPSQRWTSRTRKLGEISKEIHLLLN